MDGRNVRILILGIVIGGLAGTLVMGAGAAVTWGWRAGAAAHGHDLILVPARPVQAQAPALNPKEFIPLPNNGNGPGPGPQPLVPGTDGAQNCDKILYFYQGKLFQLRPGPMPRNGGNPEFFFMQPYEGPQIPGFPGPAVPGAPSPGLPGQPVPPTLKF